MQTKPGAVHVSDDVIEGAEAIAKFLFGESASFRRAYTAIKHGLPHFRIGNRIFVRKSAVTEWIERQENTTRTSS
jgi:hypothetical protein